MAQVRQNFHTDSENAINKQINMELYASYVYMSMVSWMYLFHDICRIYNVDTTYDHLRFYCVMVELPSWYQHTRKTMVSDMHQNYQVGTMYVVT